MLVSRPFHTSTQRCKNAAPSAHSRWHRRQTPSRRRSRRGVEILEAILAVPVLLIGTVAAIEFGIMMNVQQTVTIAATEGARHAAKGGDVNAVYTKVQEYLTVYNLDFGGTGDVRVVREDSGSTTSAGDTSIGYTAKGPGTLNSSEVRVTVCVDMSNANNQPVPNWLGSFGFSTANDTFEVSAMAQTE